jgi:hypothetical protein
MVVLRIDPLKAISANLGSPETVEAPSFADMVERQLW